MLNLLSSLSIKIAPLFYQLLYMSLGAIAIGAVLLVVRKLFDKKISPLWKYLMWIPVVIALIIPYRPFSHYAVIPTDEVKGISMRISYEHISSESNQSNVPQMPNSNETQPRKLTPNNNQVDRPWFFFAPIIWMIGAVTMLLLWIIHGILLHWRLSKISTHHPRLQQLLNNCTTNMKVQRKIRLVVDQKSNTPAIVGLFAPTIILPEYIESLDDQSISNILYHELGHYVKKDLPVNYSLLVIWSIYWFNPLVWIIFKIIRDDMELLTDSYVINRCDVTDEKSYMQSLVTVLGHTSGIKLVPRMLCMVDGKKNTQKRIQTIKLKKMYKKYRILIATSALALITVLSLVFLTDGKKHEINLYVVKGMHHERADYPNLIQNLRPVLTTKDIKKYNPTTHMLFVKNHVLTSAQERKNNLDLWGSGSAILKASYTDSFIITVDGDIVLGGNMQLPIHFSFLPEITLSDGNKGIELKHFMGADHLETDRLETAFKDMRMLTEEVFEVPSTTHKNKYYDVNQLTQYSKTASTGHSIDQIIRALVFPEYVEYKDHQQDLPHSLTFYLSAPKEVKTYYTGTLHQSTFSLNAKVLFALIPSLENVNFVIDDGNSPYEMSFVSDILKDRSSFEGLPKAEQAQKLYDLIAKENQFYYMLWNNPNRLTLFVWKNSDGKNQYSLLYGNEEIYKNQIFANENMIPTEEELKKHLAAYAPETPLLFQNISQEEYHPKDMESLLASLKKKGIVSQNNTSTLWYTEPYRDFSVPSKVQRLNDLTFLFNSYGENRALTQSELQQINEAFTPIIPDGNDPEKSQINPMAFFFMSYYEEPEEMELDSFLRYFYNETLSDEKEEDQKEYEEIKTLPNFPFNEESMKDIPVPIKRIDANQVDAILKKYMNRSLVDMKRRNDVIYSEKYHAFYSYSSDFGIGTFQCNYGTIEGDRVILEGKHAILTLHNDGKQCTILSFKKAINKKSTIAN